MQDRLAKMNKRIKELRKYLQYNQKQFADALGIAQTSVSFLEREGSNVTEQNIKTICTIFNVREEWLREGKGDMFKSLSPDEELIKYVSELVQDGDQLKKDLILTILKLDSEDWKVIKKIITSLSSSI